MSAELYLPAKRQPTFGEAISDVLSAASDVAAERAKGEVANRLVGLFSDGVLPKLVAFAALFLGVSVSLYGMAYNGIILLLRDVVSQTYIEFAAHGLILLLGVLGLVILQYYLKEAWIKHTLSKGHN